MTRVMIGSTGLPWLPFHAEAFDITVRTHNYGEPQAYDSQMIKDRAALLLRNNHHNNRRRISEKAAVTSAYVDRLSWCEIQPTKGLSGSREIPSLRRVLAVMSWGLEDWLSMAEDIDFQDWL